MEQPAPDHKPAAPTSDHALTKPVPYERNPVTLIIDGIKRLRPNAGPMLVAFLAPLAAIVVVSLALVLIGLGVFNTLPPISAMIVAFPLFGFFIAAILFLQGATAAMTTRVFLASADGDTLTLRDLRDSVRAHTWSLVAVLLLSGLAVLAGLFLFVIPGILFAVWFVVAPFVQVAERPGPVDALARSRQLIRGTGADVVGLFGWVFLVSMIVIVPWWYVQVVTYIINFIVSFGASVGLARRYRALSAIRRRGEQPPRPHYMTWIGWLMYPVALVLGTVLSIASVRVQSGL